ncbi:MAG: PaaI family thioesterase [Desulfuromonadaceae bacterium]|nr:PaaI family thioesterase [Desulfuromonadaceae bacterium]
MITENVERNVKKTHTQCIMCGDSNPMSLRLIFDPGASGDVSASFKGNSLLQGYSGILHGGVISALLDSAMAHCLFYRNIEAVTGELCIRFVASVPYDANVTLRAWLVAATPPLYQLKAELVNAGTLMASAEAKFIQKPNGN